MATLLCLPGKWPDISGLPKFDFVVGVDSGADVAIERGINPNLIIGDLDSVNRDNHPTENLLENSEQEDNDLAKALRFCSEKAMTSICIVGFTGKRSDHELGNYAALHNANHDLDIRVILDGMMMHRVVSENDFHGLAPIGTLVSIFSFEETQVQTSGLKWNINGSLGFSSRGVSNQSTAPTFSISTSGCIFVMIHES
tara:strand:+ start:105 stop:698 length:594 start_codon:yes stop_codon:yes gene_type:complete